MSNVIQTLKRTGALLMWHDYREGHFRDLSGNGRHGSATDVKWERPGVTFPLSTSRITVAHDATLDALTNATFLLYLGSGNQIWTSAGGYFFAKGTGATTSHFLLRSTSDTSNRLRMSSSTNDNDCPVSTSVYSRRVTVPPGFLGIVFNTASAVRWYADGLRALTTAGAITVVTTTNDLTIGALGGPSAQNRVKLKAFGLVNRVLTETEQAQFYAEAA